MQMRMVREAVAVTLGLLLLVGPAEARGKKIQQESLADYVARHQQVVAEAPAPPTGSLWLPAGQLSDLATDYKAAHVGDLVTILVVQDVTAQNAGNVATDRSFSASSGIDAVAGRLRISDVQNIFSPRSSQTLAGKAQASSSSKLRTSLAGRVVAVLGGGVLVVEAEREITMNNERQTLLLRGLVRPGDVAPDNTVVSNAMGNLELELKGKGVISDGTRPPNLIVRMILKLVGF
jgi:flagellar L-ring protein precursor FlgH